MVHDFLQYLVSSVQALIFDVNHRVDPVLARQRSESVLPTEAGEDRAVAPGALAVEIKLGGPPPFGSIFKFDP